MKQRRRRVGRAKVVVSKTYIVLCQHRSTFERLVKAQELATKQGANIVAVVTYVNARGYARTALDELGLAGVTVVERKAGERRAWGVYGKGLVVWLTSIRYTLHDWLVHVWTTTFVTTVITGVSGVRVVNTGPGLQGGRCWWD